MEMNPTEERIYREMRANMSDKEKEEEIKNHWSYFSPEELEEIEEIENLRPDGISIDEVINAGFKVHKRWEGIGFEDLARMMDLKNNDKNMNNFLVDLEDSKLEEPKKTFVRQGILNRNGSITNKGIEVVTAFVLNKFGKEIKEKMVDVVIEKRKSEEEVI